MITARTNRGGCVDAGFQRPKEAEETRRSRSRQMHALELDLGANCLLRELRERLDFRTNVGCDTSHAARAPFCWTASR